MPAPEPLWTRILGGVIGIMLCMLVLLLARSRGASSDQIEAWQTAIVVGAAAAGLVIFVLLRRKR